MYLSLFLHSYPFFFTRDQLLDANKSISVPHPSGIWDGLLIPYSAFNTFFVDSNMYVYGVDGNSGQTNPNVYEYLREVWGVSNAHSPSVRVPN
jgi:hypothetical protein